jgi:hypothetical protein
LRRAGPGGTLGRVVAGAGEALVGVDVSLQCFAQSMVVERSEDHPVNSQEWRRLALEDHPQPPRLFAVVSWGCAATNWLAGTLNDCPGVFCLQAAQFFWYHFTGGGMLAGLPYMQLVGMQGSAARAAGDVHGISAADLPAIRAFYGDKFRAAVVVREPLPRFRSHLALIDRWITTGGWHVDHLDHLYPEVIRSLPTGSYKEKLFVYGADLLNKIVEEVEIGPIFRMEDVTTSPQALIALINHLTAGTVEAPMAWAQAAVEGQATNRHSTGAKVAFTDWQRKVISDVVSPRAVELYRELGYNPDSLFD